MLGKTACLRRRTPEDRALDVRARGRPRRNNIGATPTSQPANAVSHKASRTSCGNVEGPAGLHKFPDWPTRPSDCVTAGYSAKQPTAPFLINWPGSCLNRHLISAVLGQNRVNGVCHNWCPSLAALGLKGRGRKTLPALRLTRPVSARQQPLRAARQGRGNRGLLFLRVSETGTPGIYKDTARPSHSAVWSLPPAPARGSIPPTPGPANVLGHAFLGRALLRRPSEQCTRLKEWDPAWPRSPPRGGGEPRRLPVTTRGTPAGTGAQSYASAQRHIDTDPTKPPCRCRRTRRPPAANPPGVPPCGSARPQPTR